jgi:hypothetical protein
MNPKRILILLALPIIIIMVVFSFIQHKGTQQAQAERYQLVLGVACLNPNFDAELRRVDIPKEWGLHEIIKQNPEIFDALIADITNECE